MCLHDFSRASEVRGLPKQKFAHSAFTLAEVLITLAIIGVVAALTIPTVIQNYQKQQAAVKLKKVFNMLNQAINLSVAQNASVSLWNNQTTSRAGILKYFNTYFKPYLKVTKICNSAVQCGYKNSDRNFPWKNKYGNTFTRHFGGISDTYISYLLADGSAITHYFLVSYGSGTDYYTEKVCRFDIDINGPKGPNVWGRDVFTFSLEEESGRLVPIEYALTIAKDGWQIKYDW